eukprot:3313422-Ditylum_brightwellii.AAC.1
MFGQLTKHDTPMVAGDHPEMDDSVVLGNEGHQNYQMLIDSFDPIVVKNGDEGQMETDLSAKMKEQYPHAIEMMDGNVPDAILDELAITAYGEHQ